MNLTERATDLVRRMTNRATMTPEQVHHQHVAHIREAVPLIGELLESNARLTRELADARLLARLRNEPDSRLFWRDKLYITTDAVVKAYPCTFDPHGLPVLTAETRELLEGM